MKGREKMEHIRKISILLVFAFLLGIIAGCGIVQVNPEKDRAQVVAEVDGEEILKGEVLDRLDREKEVYNLTDEAIKDKNNKEQILRSKRPFGPTWQPRSFKSEGGCRRLCRNGRAPGRCQK